MFFLINLPPPVASPFVSQTRLPEKYRRKKRKKGDKLKNFYDKRQPYITIVYLT
jgi:hypothetical protein